MKSQTIQGAPIADLFGTDDVRVYNAAGDVVRMITSVVIMPGQTAREAIESQLAPGERVEVIYPIT
jgi:hypothetical protein